MEREPISTANLLTRKQRTYQRWRMKQAWRQQVIGVKKESTNIDDPIIIQDRIINVSDEESELQEIPDNSDLELLGELEG